MSVVATLPISANAPPLCAYPTPDFVKATPMTSRSPAKARTIRADFDQDTAPDRQGLWRGLSFAVLRLSRHAAALSFASFAVFLVMTALEFFYFRHLSGGLASLDM